MPHDPVFVSIDMALDALPMAGIRYLPVRNAADDVLVIAKRTVHPARFDQNNDMTTLTRRVSSARRG